MTDTATAQAAETVSSVQTTLQDSLKVILDKTVVGIQNGVDFLSAQLPDVIHQLLLWKFWESVVHCLFAVVAALCLIPIWVTARKYEKTADKYQSGAGYCAAVFASIIPGGIAIVQFNITWLQIWVAPKIYLIEYAASLAGAK